MAHEVSRHVDNVTAALRHDKKPIGLLLGAGVSMSLEVGGAPLIPGMEGLTDAVKNHLGEEREALLGNLSSQLPSDSRDLESLLSYVRALVALPGEEDVRGIPKKVLSELDSAICHEVTRAVDVPLPPAPTPFQALAVWIRAARRTYPVQIFTLNYDLLVEQALEREHVAYFDGFVGSHTPVFDIEAVEEDLLPSRWSLLWKIHGSINWSRTKEGSVVRCPPVAGGSALIYPSHLKYDQSRKLPHLAMLERLRAFLKQPGSVLITCGYSFRDAHVNEVILQALRANNSATVESLLFGKIDDYADATAMATSVPNLQLLAEDGAVVGGVPGPWAPTQSDGGGEVPGHFDLGDFNRLGELIREVLGSAHAWQGNVGGTGP